LVNILQNGNVLLTPVGIDEMPDMYINNALSAYHRFCRVFWPSHENDPDATNFNYNENSIDRRVEFRSLSKDTRLTLGCSYIAFLQMHNIRINYPEFAPDQQFELYIHSIISFKIFISGYELEIAKYAFWSLSSNEINTLPADLHQRRKDIKENYTQQKYSLKKCKSFALNAAMDVCLLNFSNLAENIDSGFSGYGVKLKVESWIGTHDEKLFRINRDIYSIYHDGMTMKAMQTVREDVMSLSLYWKKVDQYSKKVLVHRRNNHTVDIQDLLLKIDRAVTDIENQLRNSLS